MGEIDTSYSIGGETTYLCLTVMALNSLLKLLHSRYGKTHHEKYREHKNRALKDGMDQPTQACNQTICNFGTRCRTQNRTCFYKERESWLVCDDEMQSDMKMRHRINWQNHHESKVWKNTWKYISESKSGQRIVTFANHLEFFGSYHRVHFLNTACLFLVSEIVPN